MRGDAENVMREQLAMRMGERGEKGGREEIPRRGDLTVAQLTGQDGGLAWTWTSTTPGKQARESRIALR